MTRWMLTFCLVGCAAPAKQSASERIRAVTGCEGVGQLRHSPFSRPYAYLARVLDAELAPLVLESASDPDHVQVLDRTRWVYGPDQRLIAREVDDDGDGAANWLESWTYNEQGAVQTWALDDARGARRGSELSLHARKGRLFRVLHDDDGDDRIDAISEYDWDADGRLLATDRWSTDTGDWLWRLRVEYLEPWPRMDRLERIDTDGDDLVEEGTRYLYDADGLLLHTEDLYGAVTEYSWDRSGQLVASVELGPTWSVTWEAAYTDLGLPSWSREDTDKDLDGQVDSTEIAEWEWRCGR